MHFLAALLTGAICAAAGAVGAGFVTARALRWHRVSAREGAHGYGIVFLGLIGLVLGLVVGLVAGWTAGISTFGAWASGLGWSLGGVLGAAALALGIAWATADHPPRLGGRFLDLELEVGASRPLARRTGDGEERFGAFLYRIDEGGSARFRAWETFRPGGSADGAGPAGGSVVRCVLPLDTCTARLLILRAGELPEQVFPLPLRPRPVEADRSWSTWREAQSGGSTPLLEAERLKVRYRVRDRQD